MSCSCPHPREGTDPRTAGSCIACGKLLATGISEEERIQLRHFYDRLAVASFPGAPPSDYEAFRGEAERRHLEGLDLGYAPNSWRDRDNMEEGRAEESDGVNYIAFDCFQHGGIEGDTEIALALEEARFLYLAYRCNRQRAAKRRGSP
jgi:hypothetical protein